MFKNYIQLTKLTLIVSSLLLINMANGMAPTNLDAQLIESINSKDYRKAIQLLNEGANPNTENAFMLAIERTRCMTIDKALPQKIDLIRTFIQKGANVNMLNPLEESPIISYNWSPEVAKMLVEAGANFMQKDDMGNTARVLLSNEAKLYPEAENLKQTINYLRSLEELAKIK